MLNFNVARAACIVVTAVAASACSPAVAEGEGDGDGDAPTDVAVRFAARVNGADVDCGATYDDVGVTGSTLTVRDLRFYVSDIAVVADGVRHDVTIDDVAPFQGSGVALLDFEDGSGACAGGSAAKNDVVTGSTDAAIDGADGGIDALEFDVGLPEEQNHLDPSTLQPPLNVTSMFWGWTAGYKFVKADLSSTGQPAGLFVHIGSAVCAGDGADATCGAQNVLHVRLDGWRNDRTVVFDLGALLADADVDANAAGSAPGCMSEPDDADCAPIFDAFGLPFGAAPAPSSTAVFTVE